MSYRVIDAIKSADMIVRELLAIQAGEEVVLVADPETDMEMVQAISGISQAVGAECSIVIMPSRPVEESLKMTKFIDKGLEAADVLCVAHAGVLEGGRKLPQAAGPRARGLAGARRVDRGQKQG